jgi:hypothetical protein
MIQPDPFPDIPDIFPDDDKSPLIACIISTRHLR